MVSFLFSFQNFSFPKDISSSLVQKKKKKKKFITVYAQGEDFNCLVNNKKLSFIK